MSKLPCQKKMSKMSKACDISPRVKKRVWDRDGHCCILCGNPQAWPNAHYIPRSQGGLGIPQNIVTLCARCHHDYDNGGKREEYGQMIWAYLKGWYPKLERKDLVYDKWDWTEEANDFGG